MTVAETFEKELQGVVQRHMAAGIAPQDIVDVMTKQASLVIDQNNLEFEIDLRPSQS